MKLFCNVSTHLNHILLNFINNLHIKKTEVFIIFILYIILYIIYYYIFILFSEIVWWYKDDDDRRWGDSSAPACYSVIILKSFQQRTCLIPAVYFLSIYLPDMFSDITFLFFDLNKLFYTPYSVFRMVMVMLLVYTINLIQIISLWRRKTALTRTLPPVRINTRDSMDPNDPIDTRDSSDPDIIDLTPVTQMTSLTSTPITQVTLMTLFFYYIKHEQLI
jgi:hypothetical protein